MKNHEKISTDTHYCYFVMSTLGTECAILLLQRELLTDIEEILVASAKYSILF